MQLIAKIYLPTLSWSGKRCRDSGPPTYQIINRTAHKHFTGLIRPTSIFTNDLSVYNTSFGSVFTRCCQGTLLKPTVQWGSAVEADCPMRERCWSQLSNEGALLEPTVQWGRALRKLLLPQSSQSCAVGGRGRGRGREEQLFFNQKLFVRWLRDWSKDQPSP